MHLGAELDFRLTDARAILRTTTTPVTVGVP